MIRKKRVELNKKEFFWHYSIVPFLLAIPLIDIFYDIKNNQSLMEIKYSYVLIFLAILVFYIQRNRLKFKKIQSFSTLASFNVAVEKTANELHWLVDYKTNNFVHAHRKFDYRTSGSWGEMITIIRIENTIFINSICDPNGLFTSLLSYGYNKRNVNQFILNLDNALNPDSTDSQSVLTKKIK
jgi:hypothetical protein